MTTETASSQQSHASSKQSATSQTSGQRPFTYKGSRPASRDTPARDSTPSTSFSSEPYRGRVEPVSPLSQDSTGRKSDGSPSYMVEKSNSPLANAGTQAQKRTASGEVKQSWIGQTNHGRHSRNTSTASKTSQISELSNDLRTRLSYAMFKVQNGWQAHNLNELEAIAAQKLSPASVTQQRPFGATSPPDDSAHPPSSQDTQPFSPERSRQTYQFQPSQAALLSPASPPQAQQHTYEDFFRDEARTGGILDSTKSKNSPHRGPTLAPPVDILPRTARRTHAINGNQPPLPPPLQTANFPSTPPPPQPQHNPSTATTRTLQTPTQQKSAMEQDAVETLMFMSSPGNSGYHPAFKSPTSPHSVVVGGARYPAMLTPTAGRRVGFASASKGVGIASPKQYERATTNRLSTAADIDRVLDEMPDRYSSSEEEDGGESLLV
ncbi:MAG: hypothetical protein Q9222_001502 [Ikaeria aurantiellina]